MSNYHRITGEYWITTEGDIEYADGDVGDMSHDTMVVAECQHIITEILMVNDWEEAQQILSQYGRPLPKELGIDPQLYAVAIWANKADPRAYAMKEWGWKRVAKNDVETWTFTASDKQVIAKGIQNIVDAEAYEEDDPESMAFVDDDPDIYIGVYVHTTKKHYEFELTELLAPPVNKSTYDADRIQSAANNQINFMTRSTLPNYYRTRPLGDDITRDVYALLEDNHGDSWNLLQDFRGTLEAIALVEKFPAEAIVKQAQQIVQIIRKRIADYQQELLDYPDDPPDPIPDYLCAGTIYGNGDWHRYHVGFDGTVYFSKGHCSDKRDMLTAQEMGFAIR